MKYRVGLGFDSHRFTENPDKKLILGGVFLPGKSGLHSHSDGDVIYHAVTDAFTGALGLDGDIGSFFPDSDKKNEKRNSAEFIDFALQKTTEFGYQLGNLDITIISENVQINPIRNEIRENLRKLLGCGLEQISVKAKTAEKMGALGRGEGISVQAVVLLEQREK